MPSQQDHSSCPVPVSQGAGSPESLQPPGDPRCPRVERGLRAVVCRGDAGGVCGRDGDALA